MIVFISGSYPYAPDGISDGARKLFETMNKRSGEMEFVLVTTQRDDIVKYLEENKYKNYYLLDDWKLRIRNIRKIAKISQNASVVHMEYPGTYYGKTFLASFIPLIIRLRNRNKTIMCTRLHEFSDARLLRKMAIIPIAFFSHYLYIPALVDREQLGKIINKNKIKPTTIGCNIPIIDSTLTQQTSKMIVSYFGAVYPGKGIEKMLYVWEKIKEKKGNLDIEFRFVGDIGVEENNQFKDYHLKILNLMESLGLTKDITITGYLDEFGVANEIAKSNVATLFFDDGLTLRRGSFLAFLAYGIPIVTSQGDIEAQKKFSKAKGIFMNDDVEQCAIKTIDFLRCDDSIREEIAVENKELALFFSWDVIADKFLSDYNEYRGAL